MKIASGIVQMLDGIDDEFARLVISLGIPDWERLRKNKPEEKQFPPFSSRLAPNEEETAAERCSEKLVDLVVLLTTKVFSSKKRPKSTFSREPENSDIEIDQFPFLSLTTTSRISGKSSRTTSTKTLRGDFLKIIKTGCVVTLKMFRMCKRFP